jgi:hypothetical protein
MSFAAGGNPDSLVEVRNRLSDREQLRWDLAPAQADADYVLALRLPNRAQIAFNRWNQELFNVRVHVEDEHLLGCYLIEASRRPLAVPVSHSDDYEALLAQLSKDSARFTEVIQDAADDLFRSSDQDSQSASSAPAGFQEGPIIGNLTELASWICPEFGKNADPGTVRKLGKSKKIWLQQVSGHTHEVWFADKRTCANVNAARLRMKQQKKSEKLQNDQKVNEESAIQLFVHHRDARLGRGQETRGRVRLQKGGHVCLRGFLEELRKIGLTVAESRIRWAMKSGGLSRPSVDGSPPEDAGGQQYSKPDGE